MTESTPDLRRIAFERRCAAVAVAAAGLAARPRALTFVGLAMIAGGSAALGALAFWGAPAVVAAGLASLIAGFLEMGLAHSARGRGEGAQPSSPWLGSGAALLTSGAAAVLAGVLPTLATTALVGAGLVLSGLAWIRLAPALPPALQTPVASLTGVATTAAGVLALTRWAGGGALPLGWLVAGVSLLHGWSWLMLALVWRRAR